MNTLVLVIVFAVLVEALIEYAKTIVKAFMSGSYKTAITQVAAIVIGVVLCIAGNADMFEALGIKFNVAYLGIVLTGIIISRGANYASDIIKRIQSLISGDAITAFAYTDSGENDAEK